MQVVCANCQLSFQAPEGATGLVCPICRSPLRPPEAAADAGGSKSLAVDWAGGTLDDLISLLSAPAWSARVEVFPAEGTTAAGEVHVIAGGVSDAIADGKSTYDALDKLRAVKGARFRVEPRLPNPNDGDLTFPGPEQGKLEERPLAMLMRYCEDYVLTSGIEVWRGNENAKVDYRRGEIVGVTVGGIDAPERLAEVMQWSSGNYRLVAPKLKLPETAPKSATPPPAAVVTPRPSGAASKTIFGMPAIDPATMAATAEKLKAERAEKEKAKAAAAAPARTTAPTAPAIPTSAPAAAAPAPAAVAPPAAAPAPAAAAAPAPAPATPAPTPARQSAGAAAQKTMFGLPAPMLPTTAPAAAQAKSATPPPAAPVAPAASGGSGRTTGQTPTVAAAAATAAAEAAAAKAPAPAPAPTPANVRPSSTRPTQVMPTTVPSAAAASTTVPAAAAPAAATPAAPPAPAPARPPQTAPSAAAVNEDKTLPTKAPAKTGRKERAFWQYIALGLVIGLGALGIYRLVMVFSH